MRLQIKYFLLTIFICVSAFSLAQTKKGVGEDDANEMFTGKTRALIVGISKYQHIESLLFADKDAEEFANFLSSNRFWNIPSGDIKLLTNENAKCGNVISELARLTQVSEKGDRLIVYFSGHGDVETITQFNNGYLLMNDTYKNNYITGAVPVNFLKEVIVTLLNKDVKVIMFTDACRSGNLAGGPKGAEFASAAISSMWKNEIKILSSQPGQLSYEDQKWGNGRGVFSFYLTQGMAGAADENKDSVITLSELEMYVGKNVAAATGNKQQPMFGGPNKFSTAISKVFPAKKTVPGGDFAGTTKSRTFIIPVDSCMGYHQQFDEALQANVLVGTEESASYYYQKIKSCSRDKDLVYKANSRLMSALMVDIQQIMNGTLAGAILPQPGLYDHGIQLIDAALSNNDLRIPVEHLKNEKRYLTALKYSSVESPVTDASELASVESRLDSALLTEPDAAYLLNAKGALNIRNNNHERAVKLLEKAMLSSPTWVMPRYFLGVNYTKEKKYDKALKYYDEALAMDPDFNVAPCPQCIKDEMIKMREQMQQLHNVTPVKVKEIMNKIKFR